MHVCLYRLRLQNLKLNPVGHTLFTAQTGTLDEVFVFRAQLLRAERDAYLVLREPSAVT